MTLGARHSVACYLASRRPLSRGGHPSSHGWDLAHGAALLGSAILTLALEAKEISAERAHALSCLDALFQIDEWGADAEAMARLEQIALDIQALNRYFSALKP